MIRRKESQFLVLNYTLNGPPMAYRREESKIESKDAEDAVK